MSSAATRAAIQRSRLYQQQFNLPDDEMLVDGQKAHMHSAGRRKEGSEQTAPQSNGAAGCPSAAQ